MQADHASAFDTTSTSSQHHRGAPNGGAAMGDDDCCCKGEAYDDVDGEHCRYQRRAELLLKVGDVAAMVTIDATDDGWWLLPIASGIATESGRRCYQRC
jgi:hypothetical protein